MLYGTQVDLFSYGVMMVHVLSGQWPFPGEAVKVNPRNPNNPNDLVGVTEFDRRDEYINLIGNEHPLMTLIQGCLNNSPSHRPTSSEVHQRVSAVAADHPPSFTSRVEMMERIKALGEEKETMRSEKDNNIAEKDAAIMERNKSKAKLKDTQSNIDSLRQSHSIEVEALQIAIADMKADNEHLQATTYAKEKSYKSEKQALEDELRTMKVTMEQQHQAQLESKMSELSAKDALISSKSNTIQNLQVKLGQALGTSMCKENLSIFSPGVTLSFTECAKLPARINGLHQGIVMGKNVYIGVDRKVFKYSIIEDAWSTLPPAPVQYARIGYLYKKVYLVGGQLPSKQVTADIHEFDEASQQWVRSTSVPPMPTARSSVTVVSWSSPPALIVCGGGDQQGQTVTVVDVYHGRTSEWHTVSPMPFRRNSMTYTIIHDILYLVGGCEGSEWSTYKRTVMSTSIPQLLDTCIQPSPIQWQSLPIFNIPYYWSNAASLGECLVVVGGVKNPSFPPKPNSLVSSVYAYCPFTSSWVLVDKLPQPLCFCITATLHTGELLVIGGESFCDNSIKVTDTTYKCSLLTLI